LIVEHPLLRGLVERETAEGLDLTCGVSIEVQTASFRSVRGRSTAAILADEVSFWRADDTSANPADEIFAALRAEHGDIAEQHVDDRDNAAQQARDCP
jgi:hypothetical protein